MKIKIAKSSESILKPPKLLHPAFPFKDVKKEYGTEKKSIRECVIHQLNNSNVVFQTVGNDNETF